MKNVAFCQIKLCLAVMIFQAAVNCTESVGVIVPYQLCIYIDNIVLPYHWLLFYF
jgi:hypothetical protein